jgi:NAD-dependent SIR2 family protein deacetylase
MTTNYDTLIEKAHANMPPSCLDDCLHCLDFGVRKQRTHQFSYPTRWDGAPELSVLLLKLHGSISLLHCQNCGTYALDPTWDYAFDAIARPSAYSPCLDCKQTGTRRPVLVSPLKHKNLEEPAIQEIWHAADKILREANEIVFAGFSLNKNDEAVRGLLTIAFDRGTTKQVTVVDRNSSAVKDNYMGIYGDTVRFAPEGDWKSFLDNSSYLK